MRKKWFPGKKERQSQRDAMIGRALSRTFSTPSLPEPCPASEEISAFLEGGLEKEQRDKLMAHLSQCDRCYEVFSLAQELIKMDEKEGRAAEKKRSWVYPSIGVAVAAVLILVIGFLIPLIGPYSPPSSSRIVTELSKKTDLQTLSGALLDPQTTEYTFGHRIPIEKEAFRTGVTLMKLEISLTAKDREKSLKLLRRLIHGLESFEGAGEVISFYTAISKSIEEGIPSEQLTKKHESIESFFEKKGLLLFMRFGEWIEAGRLAALTQNKDFFEVKAVNYFIEHLRGRGLPEGLFQTLDGVKSLLTRDELTERDFKRLESAFTEIIGLM